MLRWERVANRIRNSWQTRMLHLLARVQHRSVRFRYIYRHRMWNDDGSITCRGSTLANTEQLRSELPKLIESFNIKSMLDAPCGDFGWMAEVSLPIDRYIGFDIVPELIAGNITRYTGHEFVVGDIVEDPIPRVDLVFCRDCWIHLSFDDTLRSLDNFKRSGSIYLMTTTYPECPENVEMARGGGFRPINLRLPPFSFPEPLRLIRDGSFSGTDDGQKSLGLWKLDELPRVQMIIDRRCASH